MTPPKLPIIITTTPSYNDSNQQRRPSTPTTTSTNLITNNINSLYPSTPPPTFSLSTPTEETSPPDQINHSPLFSSPPDLLPIPEISSSTTTTNNNNKYSFNYSNSISSSSNNNHSPNLGPYDLSPSNYPPPSPSTSYRSVEFADEPYTTTLNLRDNHDVSKFFLSFFFYNLFLVLVALVEALVF